MRLESALEIVGALKRRFGEPITATDVCRDVALSYQPVYATIQALAASGAVTVGKIGQRLQCEPAATSVGALWLAHWSGVEWRRTRMSLPTELAAALESRSTAAAAAAGELVALDPSGPGGPTVFATVAEFARETRAATVRRVAWDEWAAVFAGPHRDWSVARRMVAVCGAQLMWSMALAARDGFAAEPEPEPAEVAPRRREFVD